MMKKILLSAVLLGMTGAGFAAGFDDLAVSAAQLKAAGYASAAPEPFPSAFPASMAALASVNKNGGSPVFGGGSLGTVDRALAGGCKRVVSILVDRTGIKYNADGTALAKQVIAESGGNIGHAWVRLVDTARGIDEYHGHTGEIGNDGAKYADAIRILNGYNITGGVEDLDPAFADKANPALYLQRVYSDGLDHGDRPGHAPNFEGTFCVSGEQFDRVASYVRSYDFKHYGGFYSGCGYFALGVFDAAGVEFINPRFEHDLPEKISYHGLPIRLLTPGTRNRARAGRISYVYPDAIADQLNGLAAEAGFYYKAIKPLPN